MIYILIISMALRLGLELKKENFKYVIWTLINFMILSEILK